MARSLELQDKHAITHTYPVATLDFTRLEQSDPDFVSSCVEFYSAENANLIPTGFKYASEQQAEGQRNTNFISFYARGMTPLPATSEFLDGSIADLVRPSNDAAERIVDFTDFLTGERLHAGDLYERCFSAPEHFESPPQTLIDGFDYWKGYTVPVQYFERTNTWQNPEESFYRCETLTNKLTTIDGNVLGCSMYIANGKEYAWIGFDPKGIDESFASKNFDLAAYVTNDLEKGSPFNGGYSDPYNWMRPTEETPLQPGYGLMSYYVPDGPTSTYNTEVAPVKNFTESTHNPYMAGDTPITKPRIVNEVSVQLVYTVYDGKEYMGLMLMTWDGDTLIGMNGTLYPAWFLGVVGGEGGDPDEPDPGEEDLGPDAGDDYAEGDYTISQRPPGGINAESGWLPYSGLTNADAGYHVYVIDSYATQRLMNDFWGSHKDPDKLASGIIRFGMVPNYFYPIDANTNPRVAYGIQYGSYRINLNPDPEDTRAHGWHINDRTIVQKGVVWHFDTRNGLNRTWGNYLDFEPYTNIVINVPFCGSMEIPASRCMGGSIDVSLTVNVENGDIAAQIHCVSGNQVKTKNGSKGDNLETDFYIYGNAFVELPIATTASTGLKILDRVVSAASNTAQAVLYISKGQYVSGAGKISESAGNLVGITDELRQPASNSGGTVNANLIANKKCYIEISRPAQLADGNYKKISGIPSRKARTLSGIHGFTKCSQVLRTTIETHDEQTSNVQQLEFTGSATELSEIKRLLESGVIL